MIHEKSFIDSINTMKSETPKEIVEIFKKAMLVQYESNLPLHSYTEELALFNCVKSGDIEKLDEQLRQKRHSSLGIGFMSSDPLLQAQFIVVSGITLTTRYALAGGLSEAEAFHLSDAYLQKLNHVMTEKDAIKLFFVAIHDFTRRVQRAKSHGNYSFPVVRCMKYISNHLYLNLTLSELAAECEVAPQYLSSLFHKEMGVTLMKYIRNEKLKVAATILAESDFSIGRIADILEFPSQSAFTTYFKAQYDMTPTEYRARRYLEHDEL